MLAAAFGSDIPPERFAIEWRVGPAEEATANLLPPNDGLEIFAARYGLEVAEVK